jgi:hypothetical protein
VDSPETTTPTVPNHELPPRCQWCRSGWLTRHAGVVVFYCLSAYNSTTDFWVRSEECARYNGMTR